MLLAVSVSQVLHHSEHSCDGGEHRLEDIRGGGARLFQSSFAFIRDFIFPFFANFCGMQLSYIIRGEDMPPKLCKSLRKVECSAANPEYSLNFYSAVELICRTGSTVRSLSWDLGCVNKH